MYGLTFCVTIGVNQVVGKEDFPRLVAALIRLRLENDADELLAEARQLEG
jgi:hypothetical protein